MTLFEITFYSQYRTKLVKGESEPVYLPINEECDYHQVIFAHGYYSSALHEIAHWCIAGQARRLLEDYGYWYLPDGRDKEQQKQFEQVEVKPQALEWAFCVASNKAFNVSADNLNGYEADHTSFRLKVYQQVKKYLKEGFPKRAQQFIDVLADFYQVNTPLNLSQFELDSELYQDV
ncbi:elongation factor P hydroxylase [Thalassotalea profundi]|nr:elongation factor P hydroxylase [Thalassotalea profundi]